MDNNAERPGRVLVVDDEPSLVDAVSTALRYEGFEVTEATTGRAGLAAAQESPADLIVLDVMLPDIDGFGVSKRLREDGVDTPVLFLTARDGLDDKAAGFGAGADDYLTKPFSLAELIMRVKAILRRSTGASVSYLRKKLKQHGPDLIHTVRLVGYVFREPAAA